MMSVYSELKSEHSKLMIKHNEAQKVQEHLSLQLAQLMPAEHELTKDGDSFIFIPLTSHAYGWISPPFCLLGGYKMTIQYKKGTTACLLLLKGEHDNGLLWPMRSDYELEIRGTRLGISHFLGVFSFKNVTRVLHGSSQELSNFQANIKQCTVEVRLWQTEFPPKRIPLPRTSPSTPLPVLDDRSPPPVAYQKQQRGTPISSRYRRPAPRH